MTQILRLNSLTFTSGDVVSTADADVVVLVGPNNSGKSQALLSIRASADGPLASEVALSRVSFERLVGSDGAREWLRAHRHLTVDAEGNEWVSALGGGRVTLRNLDRFWGADDGPFQNQLGQQLVRHVGPGDARGFLGSPGRLNAGQVPDHFLHGLMLDAKKRQSFQRAFKAAFQMNVIFDAWGSSVFVRLSPDLTQQDFRAGTDTGYAPKELMERLQALPIIDQQSDGVRAFSGLLLGMLTVEYPVTLLDEPETFLHPPQARRLGEYLGSLRAAGQLVIATHSLDVLLGLLQQRASSVLVVRLSREAGVTAARTITPDQIRSLWGDSILRFSRALDGLFHDGVVVCEGHSDSQLYSAVAHELGGTGPGSVSGIGEEKTVFIGPASDGATELEVKSTEVNLTSPEVAPDGDDTSYGSGPADVMFTYAGGKQRIPKVASALDALGVPVRAIVDFDVLNSEDVLRRIVESLGGELSDRAKGLRRIVDSNIRKNQSALRVGALRRKINDHLGTLDDELVTSEILAAIAGELELPAGWVLAKRKGRAALDGGEAHLALDELIAELKANGLHVVPTGAMESLVPYGVGRSSAFVADVVERDLLKTSDGARDLVASVLDAI